MQDDPAGVRACALRGLLQDSISAVLNKFEDLPVAITAGKRFHFDLVMVTNVVPNKLIALKSLSHPPPKKFDERGIRAPLLFRDQYGCFGHRLHQSTKCNDDLKIHGPGQS